MWCWWIRSKYLITRNKRSFWGFANNDQNFWKRNRCRFWELLQNRWNRQKREKQQFFCVFVETNFKLLKNKQMTQSKFRRKISLNFYYFLQFFTISALIFRQHNSYKYNYDYIIEIRWRKKLQDHKIPLPLHDKINEWERS